MSQPYRLGHPFAGRQVKLLHSSKIKIVGGEVLLSPPRCDCNFCLKQLRLDGGDNGNRYVVLESKNICEVTLEPVCPNVRARHSVNQLSCDANFARRLAHGPLKDVAHAEATPDLLDIDSSAFEGETRIASDDEQRFEPRQCGDDLFNHPIGKVLLLQITAYVLEREHRNRRLVG